MLAATIIREARKRSGLSLRKLASTAGTSHATISTYEVGRSVPSVSTLDRIIEATGFALSVTLERRIRTVNGLDRGDELIQVLDLAEEFPLRVRGATLDSPIFGRRSVVGSKR